MREILLLDCALSCMGIKANKLTIYSRHVTSNPVPPPIRSGAPSLCKAACRRRLFVDLLGKVRPPQIRRDQKDCQGKGACRGGDELQSMIPTPIHPAARSRTGIPNWL